MKSILTVILILLTSNFALAQKYVCNVTEAQGSGIKTVVITSSEEDLETPREGVQYAYTLELYSDQVASEVVRGTVEVEDVMFDFTSNDNNISLRIYLDEMDQSSLSIEGFDSIEMTCF